MCKKTIPNLNLHSNIQVQSNPSSIKSKINKISVGPPSSIKITLSLPKFYVLNQNPLERLLLSLHAHMPTLNVQINLLNMSLLLLEVLGSNLPDILGHIYIPVQSLIPNVRMAVTVLINHMTIDIS